MSGVNAVVIYSFCGDRERTWARNDDELSGSNALACTAKARSLYEDTLATGIWALTRGLPVYRESISVKTQRNEYGTERRYLVRRLSLWEPP